ncbi:S1/P1 nuclease [Thalassotalea fonticola]|uniref:S1/P1 nuclease n=1 Tax=Thalassotalea fonticola TaxID=3065649 RepID=A0ABZ0GMX0_9GAMM|nr:S1/P1 nuclease [Colwelliaceae bacterium S1-1]
MLLFIFCFSSSTYALGSKGHWLVCQLAVNNLPLAQQDSLSNLINYLPLAQKQQLNIFLKRSINHQVTFADACSWPDAIRHEEPFAVYKSWHYLNVAREQTEIGKSDCQSNCILDAITFHQQQYINAKNPITKIQALLFLAHWLGDIHQPLHISFKSDLGGNKTKVIDRLNSTKQKCKNLHQVWDRCLLGNSNKTLLLNSLAPSFESPSSDFITAKNLLVWANQSLTISRSKSVQYCKIDDNNRACVPTQDKIIFDQAYLNKNNLTLKKQLNLAAVRLHLFLSENL